ncbi:hypothetical protein L1987_37983 [Smallanthus sonchifolius]|uniref:Uncharacterized protein n=1 Tax=Smallanthus sonchifolius TaxID=185202 RepID=A0ACB9HJ55_9ASTR|nr:hypothetical protein L1987_37983 [Smallanthus sonchifolius]
MEKPEHNDVSGGFDCNICLDSVQDPVVTLCGHLYCWPCIYKWINDHINATSETLEKKNPRCPVCNCEVSQKTIVPLYGRGQRSNHVNEEKSLGLSVVIPPRPSTPRYGVIGTRDSQISHRGFQQVPPPLVVPVRGSVDITTPISPSPTIGMLGEMVSGRILGDLDSPMFGTPNSYSLAGVGSRRARRQATQADRSLSRIYLFLFCFIILCLLLFT